MSKMTLNLALSIFVTLLSTVSFASSRVVFDYSGADEFLKLLSDVSTASVKGPEVAARLDRILALPSYETTFRRYNDPSRPKEGHVPKAEFRAMVLSTFENKDYVGAYPRLVEVQKLLRQTKAARLSAPRASRS